ncbi:MAG: BON domain-containing protein [Polyangia bacterium]
MHSQKGRSREDRRFSNPNSRSDYGSGRDSFRGSDRDRSNDRYSQSGSGNSDFGPGVSDRWIQDRGRGYGNEERYGQSYGQNRGIDDRTRNPWGRGEDRSPGYGGPGYGSPGYGPEDRHGQSYGPASRGGYGRDEGSERGVARADLNDVSQSSGGAGSRGVWQKEHEGAFASVSRGGFLLDQRGYGPDEYDRNNYGGAYTGGFSPAEREFSGKGPKGYVRSDERIREDVCERLSEGHLDASDIDVQVKDGEVTLVGQVSDRRTKRLVEELLDPIKGIKDVENKLKVRMATGRSDADKLGGQKPEGQKPEGQKPAEPQRTSDNGKSDLPKLSGGARA